MLDVSLKQLGIFLVSSTGICWSMVPYQKVLLYIANNYITYIWLQKYVIYNTKFQWQRFSFRPGLISHRDWPFFSNYQYRLKY